MSGISSNENGQRLGEPFGYPLPIPLLLRAQEPGHRPGLSRSEKADFGQRIPADSAQAVPPTVDDRVACGTAMALLTGTFTRGRLSTGTGVERDGCTWNVSTLCLQLGSHVACKRKTPHRSRLFHLIGCLGRTARRVPLPNQSSPDCSVAHSKSSQRGRYAQPSNKAFPNAAGQDYGVSMKNGMKSERTNGQTLKKLLRLHQSSRMHWVGNGFPVHSVFDYNGLAMFTHPLDLDALLRASV